MPTDRRRKSFDWHAPGTKADHDLVFDADPQRVALFYCPLAVAAVPHIQSNSMRVIPQ
jgi:hypothetical protein